jgi:heat shock protein HslJ
VLAFFVPALGLAAAPAPEAGNALLLNTYWAAQTVDGAPLITPVDRSAGKVHLVLHAGSQHLSGFAGCNRIRGRYTQRGTQLALSAIAAARRACAAPEMQQEQKLIALLGTVDAYRIEGPVLSLLQGDVVRVTLTATKAK